MKDQKYKPLPEESRLTPKSKQKKKPRYALEIKFSFSWNSRESFWHDIGSSNQLEEVYSMVDRAIRGSGPGSWGLARLTKEKTVVMLRILDRETNKTQAIRASLRNGSYNVYKREWTDEQ